jgi:hypothetical protein
VSHKSVFHGEAQLVLFLFVQSAKGILQMIAEGLHAIFQRHWLDYSCEPANACIIGRKEQLEMK